ncbi:NhaP-type Na+/H+ or K+/H+ antiporter [Arthrobacter sp. 1088]|uniref:hypothetical protein n=1 Tax=Arthrobacter sp. 1088 TaxID=2817768 RepID=UPI00285E322D|nr:hypothetical protein [Arthrobacter sp. 1088]MDR6685798.1 NhaP-type Na+/H+ or K+/H+ antiporter [Arthrobacter sp. 1088]
MSVVVSGVLFHFPGALPPNNGDSFNLNPAGALVNGVATGLLVGGLQAVLLRRSGLRAWRWILGATVSLLVAHSFGDMLPDAVGWPLMAGLGGLVLGLGQWWAARWSAKVGIIWTAVTGVAWAVSMWLSYQTGNTPEDWRTEHLVVAAAVGIAVGACTAAMWRWLPLRSEQVGASARSRSSRL